MTLFAPFGVVYDSEPAEFPLGLVTPPEPTPLRLLRSPRHVPGLAPRHLRISSSDDLTIPLKHAILAARQALLARQDADGRWREAVPSVRVTALRAIVATVAGDERDVARAACRWLLQTQQAAGGWRGDGGATFDLNHSVLAYLALRLAGHEPWEEAMQAARSVIRQAGGADATDGNTRCWLARLGQIPWPNVPEAFRLPGKSTTSEPTQPQILRELFLDHASAWAPPTWRNWSPTELRMWQTASSDVRLDDLDRDAVQVDEQTRCWREIDCGFRTTAVAATALLASGVRAPVAAAVQALSQKSDAGSDLSRRIALLTVLQANRREDSDHVNLPPQLRIGGELEADQPSRQRLAVEACFNALSDFRTESRRVAVQRLQLLDAQAAPSRSAEAMTELAETIELAGLCGIDRDDARLLPAIDRLVRWQYADGHWESAKEGSHRRTCRVLHALAAVGLNTVGLNAVGLNAADEAVEAGVYWLQACQNPSGGWSGGIEAEQPAAVGSQPTAEAILALLAAGRGDCRAADRGVQYLISRQTIDGEWDDERIETTSLALLALAQWATTTRRPSGGESAASLRLVGSLD